MKVYILFNVDWEGFYRSRAVEGVFKSFEEAEAHAGAIRLDEYEIEDWKVE